MKKIRCYCREQLTLSYCTACGILLRRQNNDTAMKPVTIQNTYNQSWKPDRKASQAYRIGTNALKDYKRKESH